MDVTEWLQHSMQPVVKKKQEGSPTIETEWERRVTIIQLGIYICRNLINRSHTVRLFADTEGVQQGDVCAGTSPRSLCHL